MGICWFRLVGRWVSCICLVPWCRGMRCACQRADRKQRPGPWQCSAAQRSAAPSPARPSPARRNPAMWEHDFALLQRPENGSLWIPTSRRLLVLTYLNHCLGIYLISRCTRRAIGCRIPFKSARGGLGYSYTGARHVAGPPDAFSFCEVRVRRAVEAFWALQSRARGRGGEL